MQRGIVLALVLAVQTGSPAFGKMSPEALNRSIDKLRREHQLKVNKLTQAQAALIAQIKRDLKIKNPDLLPQLEQAIRKHKRAKDVARDPEVNRFSHILAGQTGLYDSRLVSQAEERVGIILDQEPCDGLKASFAETGKPMQKLKMCEPQGPLDPSRINERPGATTPQPSPAQPQLQPRVEETVLEPDFEDSFAVPTGEANNSGFMRVETSQTTPVAGAAGFAQIIDSFKELLGGHVKVKSTIEVLGGAQSVWVALGTVAAETDITLLVAKNDTVICGENRKFASIKASAGLEVVSFDKDIEGSTFELSCEFESDGANTTYEIYNDMVDLTSVDTLTGSVSTNASVKVRKIEITMQE